MTFIINWVVISSTNQKSITMDYLSNVLQNFSNSIGGYLPNLLGVILLLIIGFFIAKMLKKLSIKLIEKSGVDKKMNTSKIKLSGFIGKLVYFLVMIFVFILALEKLGMTSVLEPVKGLLNGFLSFIPNLVGAGLVGYIGYMLATIISELVGLSGDTIQRFVPKLHIPDTINVVQILKKVVFIFVFIPLLIAALNILNLDAISEPATSMLQSFFEAIPKILVATLILILFVVGGRFLSVLIKDLLGNLHLNKVLEDANMSSMFGKANIEKLIGNIVYFFILLFGIITAIEKLEFTKLSEILNTIIALGGNILFGLVILIIGNWLAKLVSDNFFKKNDNAFVGSIVKVAIIAMFLAIGLRTMGIADDIINLAFGITLGAIALTVVLSFGLGGRAPAGKQMEKILDKFNKN